MTTLLDSAIAKARELPPEQQDVLAVLILSVAEDDAALPQMDDESRRAIREGLEEARRGAFIPDDEIEALWKRYGA